MYKECDFGSNSPYQETMGRFLPNLKDYYRNPAAYRMEPFRIYGNLYYVGDKKVCSHLIDTGEGLILFDTGYRHALHLLIESIRELGFDPHDVKYIIHSHGHFDHFGGGNEMRSLYGSKIFMSAVDTGLLRGRPERALMHLGPAPYDDICWPDEEISDGDHICLGNTDIRCVLTPGHTMGTMTFFFEAKDSGAALKNAAAPDNSAAGENARQSARKPTGEEKNNSVPKKVVYMGGVGFLTIYKEYNREYGLPENKTDLMAESIRKVWDEPADIVLGNHPNQNCTIEKREWMKAHPGTNPFVNPEAWHIFLEKLEERRKDFAELGY